MGVLHVFGQKPSFAVQLKAAIETVQKEADKDPDTFKANVAKLEEAWGGRKDPVERGVVDAMLGSCYREMRWTHITDFDEETRAEYARKMSEHFGHVLDDMEALAAAKADDYDVLVRRGKDGYLYGHDMLSVLLRFVQQNAGLDDEEVADLQERAWGVYRRHGNLNAYANQKMEWLGTKRGVAKKFGRLTDGQYRDSLCLLLQEVKGEEVGADVALAHLRCLSSTDEQIPFLRWAVANVGDSRRKPELQQALDEALRPTLGMEVGASLLADRPGQVRINYWNCDRVTMTVRQYAGRKPTKNGRGELLLTGAVVASREVTFEVDSLNAARKAQGLPVKGVATTEFTLPVGRYVCVAEGVGDESVKEFGVSSVHLMLAELNRETWRVYVVDNETGRPLAGVKVQTRQRMPTDREKTAGWENRDLTSERLTGADGTVDVKKGLWVRAVRSERDCTNYAQGYGLWHTGEKADSVVSLRLMTDRSIYRPGQRVQGSIVAYGQEGDRTWVMEGVGVSLVARDAQQRVLAERQLTTNEWGTAAFELTLPDDCAVGLAQLYVNDEQGHGMSESVRVEEYRRPTFDVTFDGPKGGRFGQTVEAVGTAMMLAGVPVQGAAVHYVVECASADFKRWWLAYADWEEVAEGELTTDDEGHFRVPMTLTDDYLDNDRSLMRFRVRATVTDVGGESHEAKWTLNVSNADRAFDVEVRSVVDLAKGAAFKVNAYDANHEPVEADGRYRIVCGERNVAEGTFAAGEKVPLPTDLLLGVHYELQAIMANGQGAEVVERAYFTPYSSAMTVTDLRKLGTAPKWRADRGLKTHDFIYSDSTTFVEGGTVDLYFATEETDAYIIYNVYNADGLLESERAVTDGSLARLCLHHRKEWGEGIVVRLLGVRNGHFVSLERRFELARPEKRLKLEWATFRDKLQPGQQEQWTLTVTDPDGRRVSGAEMMAVLYDAALDRIYPHSWSFQMGFRRFVPSVRVWDVANADFPSFWLHGHVADRKGYSRQYSTLKGFEHDRFSRNSPRLLYSKAMVPEMAMATQRAEVEDADALAPVAAGNGEEQEAVDFENATVRENFAETAFFMPHLVSDKRGNVNIQFTLPESLTEWRFMGLAHTKGVDYGHIWAKAVARKAFMLRPNMPRFLRWGDKAVIGSSVVNQSEEMLRGAVRLRLMDAATGDVVLTAEKPFVVEAGKTVGVDFGFDVLEEWKDLECEIVAVSGQVSDGERNLLPVLSTLTEVVETVPYYVVGNANDDGTRGETKVVDLSGLYNQNSGTASHRTMKVEYTDNPAWMCIEALRSVKNPEEDDAIDYAASFYANTRLLELMRTFPVLERFEKVDELKQRVEKAGLKLRGLQMPDGGWSWFRGMHSSYYITMAVCEHLAKLPAPDEGVKAMLAEGMRYLDEHELEAYLQHKKHHRKIWPSNTELRYLYLSAQMPERAVSKDVERMREEYLTQVEKAPRDLTIYGVANAACALRSFGHVKSANRFVDFLKEYTVEKPGQGRFYATDAAYYSWMDYRIPTQIAAMKAIRQRDKQDGYLNDMQLWLIAQKQVQKWDNPMNTIDVADFLMQVSPMETFHETKKPVLSVDGHVLENLEFGTINTERDSLEGRESLLTLEGNVLADVPEDVLSDGVERLEVTKSTPGISWGAAYATFMEDVGRLRAYATNELKVQRKLYVQRAGSEEWKDYQPGKPLRVGDKLKIRHVITADRDMDFVRVSAQHPACLEPLRQLSGYQWMGGRGCYLSVHDSHFDMFFDWFTRGTSTLDMEYYVVRAGVYEVGVSTVECAYAKQFGGHTEGLKVSVESKK